MIISSIKVEKQGIKGIEKTNKRYITRMLKNNFKINSMLVLKKVLGVKVREGSRRA